MYYYNFLRKKILIAGIVILFSVAGCASTTSGAISKVPPQADLIFSGEAVFYADSFHGKRTASGEIYDRNKFTAAHRTLPFGTIVRVTNVSNGLSVKVKINDRGPFGKKGRVIDLSFAAARKIGMLKSGVARVKIEVLK